MRQREQSDLSSARRGAHAFTLLEMVVVIAILAVLAAVAVRSLSGVEDQTRLDVTQRGLADIQAAIDGDRSVRQPDGSVIPNGFVNDMGRLPNLTAGVTAATQLQELWVQPAGVASYALVSAPPPDADIKIGTGWHGPYLQLPFGQMNLLDGWGNPYSIVNMPNATTAFTIQSLGSDNAIGATGDVYSPDIPTLPIPFLTTDYSTPLTCVVTGTSSLGAAASAKLFQPDLTKVGGVGSITGMVLIIGGNATFTFSAVTPGARVIRVYSDVTSMTPLATQYIVVPKGGLPNVVISLAATTQPAATQPSP